MCNLFMIQIILSLITVHISILYVKFTIHDITLKSVDNILEVKGIIFYYVLYNINNKQNKLNFFLLVLLKTTNTDNFKFKHISNVHNIYT